MEFDFEKFNLDLEKRQKANQEKKEVLDKNLQNEQEQKRKRNKNYQELWQNRITWE